jgi:hypothetical protein
MQILVGCDPELFVTRDGKLVSGHGLIPGTKKDPFKVERGAVQVDGMALEFNIDPASDENQFVNNINVVLAEMQKMIPGHEMLTIPVAHFGAEMIASQPLVARELGCDPDYNAWEGGRENPRPDVDLPFRTASGHVHIGWTQDQDINDPGHRHACIELVKQLDFYLGLPSVIFDKDTERRSLYGKAGAFRFKPYGVEYRVLSNAWLKSDELKAWVFRATNKAVDEYLKGNYLFKEDDIQDTINGSHALTATARCLCYGLEVPRAA